MKAWLTVLLLLNLMWATDVTAPRAAFYIAVNSALVLGCLWGKRFFQRR